ncbi:hypothetical protein [Caproiciproducens sp. CPB-2]|uniref:hypothetical protein n=1 Tax=Caproiciproducens sp. CPB-2 TaxID=3030017 RepID=UPI0023DABBF1|nr:hypothetical protein [Caproiciproducens sp. CPB-2]MDF1494031.1 hypothetical protein [Caproiciproducens sp. CPB-2]
MESQSGIRTVYHVGYEDGEGTMTVLSLFPGVDLILNDFSTFHCFQSASPPARHDGDQSLPEGPL